MTARPVRNFAMIVWLASLVGASLACSNPRRGPGELPSPSVQATEPAAATPLPAATQPPTGTEPPPSATIAPSDTPLPQPTAAPTVTATTVPDPQGDLLEQMLDQFDQANSLDEAALNDLPSNP